VQGKKRKKTEISSIEYKEACSRLVRRTGGAAVGGAGAVGRPARPPALAGGGPGSLRPCRQSSEVNALMRRFQACGGFRHLCALTG